MSQISQPASQFPDETFQPNVKVPNVNPKNLYADEADEALAITRFQQELLDQAERFLKRLRLLAAISHEAETADRDLLHTEFHELVDSLDELLNSELNDLPVFQKKDRAIDLQQGSNKLVLPGISALQRFSPELAKVSVLTPEVAKSGIDVIKAAFKHLAIDQALSQENETRLNFLSSHFEEIKETL